MKSLQIYINEIQNEEISQLISEVLENNYTNEEIEDSFDDFNLMLEALSKDEIKTKLKKYIKANDEMFSKLTNLDNEIYKQLANINNEYKDWSSISNFAERSKKFNEMNDAKRKIHNEATKKRQDIYKEYDIDGSDSLFWISCELLAANNFIKKTIQSELGKKVFNERSKKLSKDEAFDSVYGSDILFIKDKLEKLKDHKLFDKIDKDDLNNIAKELNLPFEVNNDEIIINTDKLINIFKKELNYNPSEEVEKIEKLDVNDNIELPKDDNSDNDSKEEESDSSETQSEEEQKEQTTDIIKANKDLLTPIAKEANITGEQLLKIINKSVLNKNGKARKLDDQVILGLSIMLCGMILSVKKSGKKDNAAIKAILEKITKTLSQKQSIDKFINQNK